MRKVQDSPQSRTAFIAGATGYTGHALVRRLRADGVHVVAHVRPDSTRLGEWRARFAACGAHADSTPWEETAMRETLARLQPDAVFALLGTTRARVRAAQQRGAADSYETVDYGLSALLLRVARSAVPHARFTYLSSIGVGPAARGAYLRVRWRFEQELAASGLDYVIARPSFITGPDREERRPAERVAAVVTDVVLAAAGACGLRRVRDRYRSRSADELAGALAAHAFRAASARSVLDGSALFSLAATRAHA